MSFTSRLPIPLLVLGVLASLSLVACEAPAAPGPIDPTANWPLEGGTPGRTREAASQIAPPLRLEWETEVPDSGPFASPITFQNGMIYADTEASLHALAVEDGSIVWDIQLPGFFLSPLTWNDALFVRAEAGDEGNLIALDAERGAPLWQHRFPEVGSEFQNIGGHVTSPVMGSSDHVLVASSRQLFALERQAGTVEWEFSLLEPVTSSVAVAEGMALVSDFTHTYAIDAATGKEIWRFQRDEPSLFFAPVVRDHRVFVAYGDVLYALDQDQGDLLWETSSQAGHIIPAAATQGMVLAKSNLALLAYAADTGEPLWRYETLNFVSLPGISGQYLYTVVRFSDGSHVVALDLGTGEEVWRSERMPLARSAPVIAGGRLFVRSEQGAIIAFSPFETQPRE